MAHDPICPNPQCNKKLSIARQETTIRLEKGTKILEVLFCATCGHTLTIVDTSIAGAISFAIDRLRESVNRAVAAR